MVLTNHKDLIKGGNVGGNHYTFLFLVYFIYFSIVQCSIFTNKIKISELNSINSIPVSKKK